MKSNLVRSVRNSFFLAVAAGLFIGVGGSVLLSCDNRYLGAVLFSIALLAICTLGLYLFTGKIGYLWNSHTLTDVCCIVAGLLGNMAGTWLSATALRFCRAPLIDVVRPMVDAKLTQAPLQSVLTGIFCGLLMYTAVAIYKEKGTHLGIFFCVPVFILAGFEHSIADMFYFFTAGMFTPKIALFLLIVVVGNAIGGMLIPGMKRLAGE
jgi:formate/nitrite transporter FocA (FNT family)